MNSTPPPLPSEKVLIVDDDPVVVKAISMKLMSKGYKVCTAMDGSQAVKAVREEKPDIMVLDISFPPDVGQAWDGFRIIEWLRRFDEAKKVPIIIMSGGEIEKYKNRALAAGAVAYFQKPVDNEELLSTIRKTLIAAASAAPAAPSKPGGSFNI